MRYVEHIGAVILGVLIGNYIGHRWVTPWYLRMIHPWFEKRFSK